MRPGPRLLGLLLAAGILPSALHAAQKHPIEIGSIDGASTVDVRSGEKTEARPSGHALTVGDRLITRPGMTVSVRYADGSVLIAGQGTELTVRSPEQAEYA